MRSARRNKSVSADTCQKRFLSRVVYLLIPVLAYRLILKDPLWSRYGREFRVYMWWYRCLLWRSLVCKRNKLYIKSVYAAVLFGAQPSSVELSDTPIEIRRNVTADVHFFLVVNRGLDSRWRLTNKIGWSPLVRDTKLWMIMKQQNLFTYQMIVQPDRDARTVYCTQNFSTWRRLGDFLGVTDISALNFIADIDRLVTCSICVRIWGFLSFSDFELSVY